MFREDSAEIQHKESKETIISPGSTAEKVHYQTEQDSDKMRRWRGWHAMMEEGDSKFNEMFGYTRFQKALATLAAEYGLEEYYADEAHLASIYYRTQLDETHPTLSDTQKDIEAYLHGKEVLLTIASRDPSVVYQESEQSGYQSIDTRLPSERVTLAYRKIELARAEAAVLQHVDDVYLNIGDPFEWTNENRDRVDEDGNPTTFLVEYSPGDGSSFIGTRNPADMAGIDQLNRATDPDNVYDLFWGGRGSMISIVDALLELDEGEDRYPFSTPDKEWLHALEKPLRRASQLHQQLSHQTNLGDYLDEDGLSTGGTLADLQEMQRLWEQISSINQERYATWQAMGKDPKRPAYDISEGLSPIDLLAHLIDVDVDNLRSVARGLEATIQETPGLLHQWFEDLADAHMKFEQGMTSADIDPYELNHYENIWLDTVKKVIPDFTSHKKGDLSQYNGKMADILFEFFRTNGFSIIRPIDPALYARINTELTETILQKHPHVPKTNKAALLEEVFPNTSLPDRCIDRATACWSLSRQAMTVMTDTERQKIWTEFDRILKPGGRATIYPIDYWYDENHPQLDEENITEMLERYKQETQSTLQYELKYGSGKFREHLVLILTKPTK